jgi:hypothetical protein
MFCENIWNMNGLNVNVGPFPILKNLHYTMHGF